MHSVQTQTPPAYKVGPRNSNCLAAQDRIINQALNILRQRLECKSDLEVSSPQTIGRYLAIRDGARKEQNREVFTVAYLDSQHRLIETVDEFVGTLAQTSVYPREIARSALRLNAAAVILSHNHPSGVLEPSTADINLTGQIKSSLNLIDVRVLDHIITGHGNWVSMADRGDM